MYVQRDCRCLVSRRGSPNLCPHHAGHLSSPSHTNATWKIVEKHLQDLPLSWFEETSTDNDNIENHSPNAQPAPASISSAVIFVSTAPQNLQQLTDFIGAPQGKCSISSTVGSSVMSSALQGCHLHFAHHAPICRCQCQQHLTWHELGSCD